jgi:O-antigen/teichoic acid export membrane protein
LIFNFALLAGGELVAKLLTFVAFSFLARTVGASQFGLIEFTLAVMVFFTLPAEMGLGSYGAREIARHPRRAGQLLSEIVQLRLCLASCSILGLIAFAVLIQQSPELKLLLLVYGASLASSAFMLQWFFQGHEKMHWVAIASIIKQLTFAGLVLLFLRGGTSIVWIGAFEFLSASAVAIFSCVVVKRLGYPLPNLRFRKRRLLRHLRAGVPIGMTELAWAFIWYFATVLLGFAFDHQSLGWFGASHRMLMALHTFVWLYFFNLLPLISRVVAEPKSVLLRLMENSIPLAIWVSVLVAFLGSALSNDLLSLVYGEQFRGAGLAFSILIWVLPIAMISGHHRYTLLAYNLQTRLLYCTIASALLAMMLGAVLVRQFGALGAAWALVGANSLNFLLAYYSVRRHVVRVPVLQHLAMPLTALAVATLIFRSLSSTGVWTAASVAATVYCVLFAVSQKRELATLFRGAQTRFSKMVTEASLAK